MTDLRKAAEMALETLERLDKWLALRYGNELTPPEREVVKALRQALAMENFSEVNQEIEEALKQPKQDHIRDATKKVEPVAWMFQHSETGNLTFFDNPTMVKLFGESNKRWGSAIPLYVHAEKCAEITKQGAEKCGR
jgi:hypothetical protein